MLGARIKSRRIAENAMPSILAFMFYRFGANALADYAISAKFAESP